MRRKTAEILSFYSERARGVSLRYPLAGVAWRALVAAAARGDGNAVEAVWQAWLRHPDGERWELLCRCRGAGGLAEAVFAAATDPARPPESRAALGAFCTDRGLAPSAPAQRAVFFLLTGQPGQHRAADPDGAALTAAYRAADEPVRAALRQAMASAGGLDLVRVVAAQGGDGRNTVPETEAECRYLVTELARNRDWPRLWRLALDFPLAEAAAAAQRLPTDWGPADEAGRRLLARLAAAQPAELRAMASPAAVRFDVRRWWPIGLDSAPDSSETAMVMARWDVVGAALIYATRIHALPSGRRLGGFPTDALLHFGDAFVYLDRRHARLLRHVRGQGTEQLASGEPNDFRAIARVREGFVVAGYRRLLYGNAPLGAPLRDVTPPSLLTPGVGGIERMVSESRTGYLAVGVSRGRAWDLVVLGPDFGVIARRTGFNFGQHLIGFCGPETLITSGREWGQDRPHLVSWRVHPPEISEAAAVPSGYSYLRMLPASRTLVHLQADGHGELPCLDAKTLQPVPCPGVLAWAQGRPQARFNMSPDGRHAAIGPHAGKAGDVEVRDLVRQEACDLLQRPLARFRHADLTTVASLASRTADPTALAALGLLRACLEHRFAADVAIGGVSPAGPDDIALAADNG